MATIELRGKYAIGDHRFAQVDDGDFTWLNNWAWKAKWNAGRNNIYAVRVERIDGKSVDIRMHREVLGLQRGDAREVDHLDHFGLNNQRKNLRIATRSENILNARRIAVSVSCSWCGHLCERTVSAVVTRKLVFCSRRCNRAATASRQAERYEPRKTVLLLQCEQCKVGMTGAMKRKRYCSDICRSRAKRTPRPSMVERIIATLEHPQSSATAALGAGVHESDARRVLARLVRDSIVRVVHQRRGDRGRPRNLYQRAGA